MSASYSRTFNVDSQISLDDGFVVRSEALLTLFNAPEFGQKTLVEFDLGIHGFPPALPLQISNDLYDRLDDIRYIGRIMYLLLHCIPIRLRKRESLPKEGRYVTGDYLGLYCSNQGQPHIDLFPENIADNADGKDLCLLSCVVLIHELAHAMMDPDNYASHKDCFSSLYQSYLHPFCNADFVSAAGKDNSRHMNFYHVREESFANLITWRVFRLASDIGLIKKTELAYVESFMKSQPHSYSFALDIKPANGIKRWLECKEFNPVQKDDAFKWMEIAENYHLSSKKEYSVFREQESKIPNQLPWLKDKSSFIQAIDKAKPIVFAYRNGYKETGVANPYGDSMLEPKYIEAAYLINGSSVLAFAALSDQGWELLSPLGEKIIPDNYDDLIPGKESFFVCKQGHWIQVKKNGLIVKDFQNIQLEQGSGCIHYSSGSYWGTMDLYGKKISNGEVYSSFTMTSDSEIEIASGISGNSNGVLVNGVEVIPIVYTSIETRCIFGPRDTTYLFACEDQTTGIHLYRLSDGKLSCANRGGIPISMSYYCWLRRGIAFEENGKWGILNNSLDVVATPQYYCIKEDFPEKELLRVKANNRWGIIKFDGKSIKVIRPCDCGSIAPMGDDYYLEGRHYFFCK